MSIYEKSNGRPSFADIIAPVTEETFFSEYYDKKPLHIPGGAGKLKGLMEWPVLTRLLNKSAIWSEQSLKLVIDREGIPSSAYCEMAQDRAGNMVQRPNAAKVMEILKQGATLVCNDIDTLTPELCGTSDAFEETFDAKVQVNLYCSWRQRQAFNSHFDTHDVFALHTEGEKMWRVYSTRMPHSVRHARHRNEAYSDQVHEQQRGPVLMEVQMTPGDVLYLPRGWYHDALAASGGTVHMAFGVTSVIGFDTIGALGDFAIEDEAFRLNLPRSALGKEPLAAALADLGDRLKALSRKPEFVDAIHAHQKGFRTPRMGFDLPVEIDEQRFALSSNEFKVVQQQGRAILANKQGGVPIPPGQERLVSWVLSNKKFERGAFLDAHTAVAVSDLDKFLLDLVGMGVLKKT